MDSIVTARVPVEIKDQVNAMLAQIGATPTQLINSAYEYVLDNGALPETKAAASAQHKALPADRESGLLAIFERTTFRVPEAYWQGKSYKELIAEGKRADYEALA